MVTPSRVWGHRSHYRVEYGASGLPEFASSLVLDVALADELAFWEGFCPNCLVPLAGSCLNWCPRCHAYWGRLPEPAGEEDGHGEEGPGAGPGPG